MAARRRTEVATARNSALKKLKDGDIDVQGLVVLAAVDEDVAGLLLTKVMAALGRDQASAELELAKIGIKKNRRIQWFFTRTGNPHLKPFLKLVEHPGRPKLPPDWLYR